MTFKDKLIKVVEESEKSATFYEDFLSDIIENHSIPVKFTIEVETSSDYILDLYRYIDHIDSDEILKCKSYSDITKLLVQTHLETETPIYSIGDDEHITYKLKNICFSKK